MSNGQNRRADTLRLAGHIRKTDRVLLKRLLVVDDGVPSRPEWWLR
jgi:hypothetical protein